MEQILALIALAIVLPSLALGQIAGLPADRQKVFRIGLLSDFDNFSDGAPWLEALKQGLRDLGYVEGQNVLLEQRNAQSNHDLLDQFAAELVNLTVDVIVVSSTTAATAAKQATKTIPIIFWAADPVSSGIVPNLERPGGNLTGITQGPEQQAKWLTLLKETVPGLTRVAVLFNRSYSPVPGLLEKTESGARSLGLQLQLVEVQAPKDLEQAFAAMRRERVGGLLVLNHPMFYLNGKLLAELAVKHRLPMLAPYRPIAEAGGLIGYEPDFQQVWRRAATFVDRILKGTKVGELPIDQSARSCIFVNLKTAKALDLTIPQAVLRQADELIQ